MEIRSRGDLITFLNKIESELPVQRWKVKGLDLWPILRVQIYVRLLHQMESTLGSGFSKPTPLKSKKSKLLDNRRVRKFKSRRKLSGLKSVDVLFAEAASHRSPFEGEYYSKFFDPIRRKTNKSSVIIEHSALDEYQHMSIHDKGSVKFLYDYLNYVTSSTSRRERVTEIKKFPPPERYEELAKRLEEAGIGEAINQFKPEYLPYLSNRLLDFYDTYNAILDKTSPNLVMTVCYYSFPVFALTAAARARGIRVVEVQHGPQNNMHPAYYGWMNVPEEGYNTLPDIFWNWDAEAKRVIDSWSEGTKHRSIVGGNPWISFFADRSDHRPKEEGYVLYSLQGLSLEFMFPPDLIQLINESDLKWWLRMHPGQSIFREEVRSFLKEKGIIDKVELDEASELPLPVVLDKAKIHITNFSGCAIEASQIGIHTILIDERGRESYGNLIDDGTATYCADLDDLPQLIEEKSGRKEKSANIDLREQFEKFYP